MPRDAPVTSAVNFRVGKVMRRSLARQVCADTGPDSPDAPGGVDHAWHLSELGRDHGQTVLGQTAKMDFDALLLSAGFRNDPSRREIQRLKGCKNPQQGSGITIGGDAQ